MLRRKLGELIAKGLFKTLVAGNIMGWETKECSLLTKLSMRSDTGPNKYRKQLRIDDVEPVKRVHLLSN